MSERDGARTREFVDRLGPALRSRLSAWRVEVDRRAAHLERVADAVLEHLQPALGPEAWHRADPRDVEVLVIRTEAEIAVALHEGFAAAKIGEGLQEVALALLRLGRESAGSLAGIRRPEDGDPSDGEDPGVAYAFARSIADEALPETLRTAVTDHARLLLTHKARVATETTRWMYALLRAEEAVRREGRTVRAAIEASGGAGGEANGAGGVAGGPEAESPEGDPSATRTVHAPRVEEARRELEVRAGSLHAAATALRSALAVDGGVAIADAVERAITERHRQFEPGRRKWRAAAREAALETSAEPDREPSSPWLDRLELPRRFAAETGRIRLCAELLRFETFARSFARHSLLAIADDSAGAAVDHLTAAVSTIRALGTEAAEWFDAEPGGPPLDVIRLLRRGRAAISKARQAVDQLVEARGPDVGAAEGLGALMARIGDLPTALRVAPLLDSDEAKLGAHGDTLDCRDWAEDVFTAPVLETLSDAGRPYLKSLREAAAALPRALDVMEYNLGAANLSANVTEEGAAGLQRELVVIGLARTADRLDEAVARLEATRTTGPEEPEALMREVTRRLRERAEAEGGVGGHARDAFGVVRESGRRRAGAAGRRLSAGRRRTRALARLMLRRGRRAWGRARAAVGAASIDTGRADDTARTLAEIDVSARSLPFVYRRLFSYGPLEDPGLLVGRTKECEALDEHLVDWETASATGLLLVGTSGVGVTSLLLTTRERWYGRVDWRAVPLTARIEEEEALARRLGETLEIDPAPRSLAEVEEALLARPRPAVPLVCAMENLEHLYFRGVLARGLIAPMLKLVSATDTVVLWIASIPASAWDVVRATDPGLAALLRVIRVSALARPDLEAAVLTRHRRSGIPLQYAESAEAPLGVRRALAREADPAHRRRLMRDAFFDRLHELSEGYVALALLYWLRSIDLEGDAETMTVRWPRPIDFAAWDDLEHDAGFALRAFLEHGSMDIAEYARLFGVSQTAAFAVFERLGGLLILEAVGDVRTVGSQLAFHRLERGRRYRIRPVLVRPVERVLIARRLLY